MQLDKKVNLYCRHSHRSDLLQVLSSRVRIYIHVNIWGTDQDFADFCNGFLRNFRRDDEGKGEINGCNIQDFGWLIDISVDWIRREEIYAFLREFAEAKKMKCSI